MTAPALKQRVSGVWVDLVESDGLPLTHGRVVKKQVDGDFIDMQRPTVDAQVIALGPYAYYLGADASGNVADSSGNGHNGGGSTGTATYQEQALLPGLGRSVETEASASFSLASAGLSFHGQFSAAIVLRPKSLTGPRAATFLGKTGGGPTQAFLWRWYSDGTISDQYNNTTAITSGAGALMPGQVGVLVLVGDASGTVEMFLDGTSIGSGTRDQSNNDGSGTLIVGSSSDSFWGTVDIQWSNLALFDRALTDDEVASISAALRPPQNADPILAFEFDDLTGITQEDSWVVSPAGWAHATGNPDGTTYLRIPIPDDTAYVETKLYMDGTGDLWSALRLFADTGALYDSTSYGCLMRPAAGTTSGIEGAPGGGDDGSGSHWTPAADSESHARVLGLHVEDPNTVAMYVDGVLVQRMVGRTPQTGGYIQLGTYNGAGGHFDYLHVYDHMPSDGDVYREAVMADNPLALWLMNELGGTEMADRSLHGLAGAYDGTVSLGADGPEPRVAARFAGAGGAHATIDLSSYATLTVEFLLNWDAYATDDALAMEYTADWNSSPGLLLDPNAGDGHGGPGVWLAGISGLLGSTVNHRTASFSRPSAGDWHHYSVIFTHDDARPQVMVDGVVITTTLADTLGTTAGSFDDAVLYLMSRDAASLFGSGAMCGVAVFAGALTDDQRQAHAAAAGF